MNWRDRIVSDPEILVGKPTIKGTRISVGLLLDRLADGWSMDDILTSYPHITRETFLRRWLSLPWTRRVRDGEAAAQQEFPGSGGPPPAQTGTVYLLSGRRTRACARRCYPIDAGCIVTLRWIAF